MPFRLHHSNCVDAATLTGGLWDADQSLEMLRDPRPTSKARSVDAQAASTKFRILASAPVTLMALFLVATNLSGAAQVKVSWFGESTFDTQVGTTGFVSVGSTIDWSDTGEWLEWEDPNFWLGSAPFSDPENMGRDVRIPFSAATSMQFIQVEMSDETNPDGVVDVGYVFAGPALDPQYNFSEGGNRLSRISNTSIATAASGSRYSNRRGSAKQISVAWEVLPMTDVIGEIDTIVQLHDLDRPLYIELDSDDSSAVGKTWSFLATLAEIPDYQLRNVFFASDLGAAVGFHLIQVI